MDNIYNRDWIISSKRFSTSYIEEGDILIILLPGYSLSGKWAIKHYPALLKDSICYAINWPGYYGSEINGSSFSIELLHDFILDVMNSYNKTSIHLIGHSFGARVAIAYSAKYPKHINKLSLIAPVLSINPLEKIISILPHSFIEFLIRKCINRKALERLSRFMNSLGLLSKTDNEFILMHTKDQSAMSVLQYYANSLAYLQISKTMLCKVFSSIQEIKLYLSNNDPYCDYSKWSKIIVDKLNVTIVPLNGGHFGRILE